MSVEDFTAERKRLAAEATREINSLLPAGYFISEQRKLNIRNTTGEFEVMICVREWTSQVTTVTKLAFELIYCSLMDDDYSIRFRKALGGTTRWHHFPTLEEAIMVGCTRHKLGAYKGAV